MFPGPLLPVRSFLRIRKDELEMQAVVLGEWTESLCKAECVPSLGQTLERWNTDEFNFTHHLCKALLGSDHTEQPWPCFDMGSTPTLKGSDDRQMKCFCACFANNERSYMFWGLLP